MPGRLCDTQSEGCNHLIKTNKAALIQSAKDIEYIMGWETKNRAKVTQQQLFVALTPEQQAIAAIISKHQKIGVDELSLLAKLPMSKITSELLEMEFGGVVKTLPGKVYKLI